MPVLVEFISVIVRRDAIEKKYPMGWEGFVTDCPNQTLCADTDLARVGFMSPYAVQQFCEDLQKMGLTFLESGEAVDFAVVDQLFGPTTECSWIEGGKWERDPYTVSACRLVGSTDTELATPEDCQFEEPLSESYTFIPHGGLGDRFS